MVLVTGLANFTFAAESGSESASHISFVEWRTSISFPGLPAVSLTTRDVAVAVSGGGLQLCGSGQAPGDVDRWILWSGSDRSVSKLFRRALLWVCFGVAHLSATRRRTPDRHSGSFRATTWGLVSWSWCAWADPHWGRQAVSNSGWPQSWWISRLSLGLGWATWQQRDIVVRVWLTRRIDRWSARELWS